MRTNSNFIAFLLLLKRHLLLTQLIPAEPSKRISWSKCLRRPQQLPRQSKYWRPPSHRRGARNNSSALRLTKWCFPTNTTKQKLRSARWTIIRMNWQGSLVGIKWRRLWPQGRTIAQSSTSRRLILWIGRATQLAVSTKKIRPIKSS